MNVAGVVGMLLSARLPSASIIADGALGAPPVKRAAGMGSLVGCTLCFRA